jgi:hypothetical protein
MATILPHPTASRTGPTVVETVVLAIHRTLRGLKGVALAAMVVLPVSAATVVTSPRPAPAPSVTAQLARAAVVPGTTLVASTVALERCHGPGALVVTRHGRIKQVGLARGLRVYVHKAPGYFLALCPRTSQGS